MIDGVDGSGKGTAVDAWKDYLTAQGNAIFDLPKYWLENKHYPELSEMKACDFIFSCEPTRTGVGKVIREEMIKTGNDYPAQAIAEAYSLDRLVLYKKIILPMLADGRCVIQDRGVCTSLCYQSVQNPELTFDHLSKLTGNKLALENRPDHLILMDLSAQEAINRLNLRTEKKDNAIFEKISFITKAADCFRSESYQKLFSDRGTQIHYLSAEQKIDIMREEAIKLLKNILKI